MKGFLMPSENVICEEMLNIISSELQEIEATEEIQILFAVESGGRAWGFASPDSDYDVRIVYAHKPEWYLRLDNTRDVIEWKLDDTLDISGWDIQKALRLMRGSNPSLLEWLSSPFFYRPLSDMRISDLADQSFDPRKSCHHYMNMAKNNTRDHLNNDTVKLKKYFYVIRSILAVKHIIASQTQPPILFEDLVNEYLDDRLVPIVKELLDIKRSNSEILFIPRCNELNTWIFDSLDELETFAKDLPPAKKLPWDEYNDLFLDLISH